MKTLEEILAAISNIAAAGNIEDVKADIASVKEKLDANTAAIAANDAEDEATKSLVAENRQLIESLVDKLAAAPAPAPTDNTGSTDNTTDGTDTVVS